jgi:hypothetical protein
MLAIGSGYELNKYGHTRNKLEIKCSDMTGFCKIVVSSLIDFVKSTMVISCSSDRSEEGVIIIPIFR